MRQRAVTLVRGLRATCRALVSALLLTSAAAAQRTVHIDVTGADLRYADTLNATSFGVSPALELQSARASLRAAGTFSRLGSAGWSMQGAVGGGLYSPTAGRFVAELAGSAGASAHRDGNRTGRWLAGVRGHVLGSGSGLWIGGAAGRGWDGVAWRNIRQLDVGGWAGGADRSALLSLTPSIVDDTIRYVDTQLALEWAVRSLEWSALAGFRAGDRVAALGGTQKAWGSVSLVAWLVPWGGLVAGAGTYPVDLTQGYPGGRFITLGVRVRPPVRPSATAASATSAAAAAPAHAANGGMEAFDARPAARGEVTLRIRAPKANRVEINGDFTLWQPVPLVRDGTGWWAVTLPIESGTHEMVVRTDGGDWVVPPGLTAVADEFGGRVGILVVQR